MSVPVPSILQTYTPFPYPILSAFPVRFPSFPHKRNNILSCPRRKRGQKPERDIILSRSFAVRIHKRINILPPNLLSAHKRRKERDNNMSLLLCLRIRKGQYIIPLMHCLSARKGQYYVPSFLLRFPEYFTRGTIYCPF